MPVMMLASVDLCPGNLVRFMPQFADIYHGQLAHVEEIIGASEAGLPYLSPLTTPYWIKVRFDDGKVKTFNAHSFVIEEPRCTQPVGE